jgi:hypothetical protein
MRFPAAQSMDILPPRWKPPGWRSKAWTERRRCRCCGAAAPPVIESGQRTVLQALKLVMNGACSDRRRERASLYGRRCLAVESDEDPGEPHQRRRIQRCGRTVDVATRA